MSFSASFDPDDPTLIDRYPNYTSETDLKDHLHPHNNGEKKSMRKASDKKKIMSAIP